MVVGTEEGVFILAPQATGPVLADLGWPGSAATAVASPAPGVVLAATSHGVLRLAAGPGGWADAGWADGGLPGVEIAALTAVSGRAVAATRDGAMYQATEPGSGPPAWSALPAPPAAASVLLIAGDRMYAATASDVLMLGPGGTWQPAGQGAPAGVTSLAIGSDSTVWAGSPLGVASLPPQAGEWREDPNDILGDGVTALAMTPDGRLAAAASQGIWARSAAGAWEAVADPGAASLNALAYAADGTLWAAASDAALILPQAAAAPVAVRPASVFAGLTVQADDLAKLDQGGCRPP